jgi:hypothetical protein
MSLVRSKTYNQVNNNEYIKLNDDIHNVITELTKLDTKQPTPIEFIRDVTIQQQQYPAEITNEQLLQNETARFAREYQLQVNDAEPKRQVE